MRFLVLTAGTAEGMDVWKTLWCSWPSREVMAHPEYVRLFARGCDRAGCTVGEGDGCTIPFRLILRPLAAEPWARPGERSWDAVTSQGYGGPIERGDGSRDGEAFWRAHASWCRDERLVSTSDRCSLFPEQIARIAGPVLDEGPNVVRTLVGDLDVIWRDYAHKVQRNVQAAERAGPAGEVDLYGGCLGVFVDFYTDAMRRRNAKSYFLPAEFFQANVERLQGQYAFFRVVSHGAVLSSELVLRSAEHVYSFLGGTRADVFELRPNDLLKHRVAKWAFAEGKKAFALGGGYKPGDGVFRYMLVFAPRGEVPFRAACLLHDKSAYREIATDCVAFEALQGRSRETLAILFPSYRA